MPVARAAAPGSTEAAVPITTSSVNPVPHAPSVAAPADTAKASAAPPPKPAAPPGDAPLSDPPSSEISSIIHAFAAKEEEFKEARDNYAYHQINKVETLDANGDVDGSWEQDWDIMFNENGGRILKVTYAPPGDLKDVLMTEQDIKAFQDIQPFVLTTQDLPEYNIRYLGHVHVDYLTCYVFSVRPKEIKKRQQYFDGVVWVDDRDLQVVKAEGRNVPQTRNNRFPRFTTWRQQIDGKYWFPTFTKADDMLYFPAGPPVHIVEIIKYTDYKQFKAKSKIISYTPIPPNPPATKPKQ